MDDERCFGTTAFWTEAARENLMLEYDVLELGGELRREEDNAGDGMWTRPGYGIGVFGCWNVDGVCCGRGDPGACGR